MDSYQEQRQARTEERKRRNFPLRSGPYWGERDEPEEIDDTEADD
jgi:hypothetical protein